MRDVLTALEDRRALYNPCAWEMPDEVSQSALHIREVLTDALQRLGEEAKATPAMKAMRMACCEHLDCSRNHYGHHDLSIDLGRLRVLSPCLSEQAASDTAAVFSAGPGEVALALVASGSAAAKGYGARSTFT